MPAPTASRLDQFVKDVTWMFGDQVKSIVLFGSAVTDDWHANYSDYNLLIVLQKITQAELAKFSNLLPSWLAAGNPPPLLMTPEELERSADVFPMEFLDCQESHRLLFGANLVGSLRVSRANLRHECEHELRGAVMRFRTRYAAIADRPHEIKELLIRSWSTFAVIGRHLLRLADQPVPPLKLEVYAAVMKMVGGDDEVFRLIHQLRVDPWTTLPMSWADLTSRYLTQLDKIVPYVDRLGLKREYTTPEGS